MAMFSASPRRAAAEPLAHAGGPGEGVSERARHCLLAPGRWQEQVLLARPMRLSLLNAQDPSGCGGTQVLRALWVAPQSLSVLSQHWCQGLPCGIGPECPPSALVKYLCNGDLASGQSCLTLCGPKDCSPPGSSVHGTLQARILEWAAIPFSRGSSRPQDRTRLSCTAGRFFTL